MKKYIITALLFGFAIGYLSFLVLDEYADKKITPTDVHMNHTQAHQHDQQEIQSEQIPTLSVEVYPDAKSGYNIKLITENFIFTPERVNTENIENQGHAHIYINNEKVARVYSEWFHIDNHHLSTDINELRVTLNANDHSEWSLDGEPLEFRKILNESVLNIY